MNKYVLGSLVIATSAMCSMSVSASPTCMQNRYGQTICSNYANSTPPVTTPQSPINNSYIARGVVRSGMAAGYVYMRQPVGAVTNAAAAGYQFGMSGRYQVPPQAVYQQSQGRICSNGVQNWRC